MGKSLIEHKALAMDCQERKIDYLLFYIIVLQDLTLSLTLSPQNPFHPGEMLLEEFLEPAGINQSQFALKLG